MSREYYSFRQRRADKDDVDSQTRHRFFGNVTGDTRNLNKPLAAMNFGTGTCLTSAPRNLQLFHYRRRTFPQKRGFWNDKTRSSKCLIISNPCLKFGRRSWHEPRKPIIELRRGRSSPSIGQNRLATHLCRRPRSLRVLLRKAQARQWRLLAYGSARHNQR